MLTNCFLQTTRDRHANFNFWRACLSLSFCVNGAHHSPPWYEVVVVVVLQMPGWPGGSPFGEPMPQLVLYYLLVAACRHSIIRLMFSVASFSAFQLSSLNNSSYGMFTSWGIATHSVMMCFWSSWWALQNLHDMFPWYFAFWLAFTMIMLLLVISIEWHCFLLRWVMYFGLLSLPVVSLFPASVWSWSSCLLLLRFLVLSPVRSLCLGFVLGLDCWLLDSLQWGCIILEF